MTEHLTDNLLQRYWQRALSTEELRQLDGHTQSCLECQTRLLEIPETGLKLSALQAELADTATLHLTYEELAALVDQRLTAFERDSAQEHLRTCPRCAAELADLRAFRRELDDAEVRQIRPAPLERPQTKSVWSSFSSWRWAGQLAATTAACLLVTFLATRGLRREVTDLRAQLANTQRDKANLQADLLAVQSRAAQTAKPFAEPPPAATPDPTNLLAILTDGGRQITLDRQGQLNGLSEITAAQRQLVLEALQTGKVVLPAAPTLLGKPPEVLLGAPPASESFALLSPVGKIVLTNRPQLRWQPLKGATSYRVTIFSANYEVVAQSPELSTPNWTPPQPLPREQVYLWQVTATKDGQEIKAPIAPSPEARFKVLAQAPAEEIAAARRRAPASALLLGLLYARAGLLEEADQEFRQLAQANPQMPVAQQLLHDLRTQRRALSR